MFAVSLLLAAALAQQPPAPQPFPRAGTQQPPPATPSQPVRPATPAPAAPSTPAQESAPGESQMGVPIYPGAQFLASYDAGRGQRYFLFGTTASFVDVVTYYRNILKQRGELVFDAPATHQFDIGRFREETMAFPPSVTVKEFQSLVSQGYPNPRPDTQPARFPTVIQIVPAGPP
jgi:hypothetical protein